MFVMSSTVSVFLPLDSHNVLGICHAVSDLCVDVWGKSNHLFLKVLNFGLLCIYYK